MNWCNTFVWCTSLSLLIRCPLKRNAKAKLRMVMTQEALTRVDVIASMKAERRSTVPLSAPLQPACTRQTLHRRTRWERRVCTWARACLRTTCAAELQLCTKKHHGAAWTAGHGYSVVLRGPQDKKPKAGPESEVTATGRAMVTERTRTPRQLQSRAGGAARLRRRSGGDGPGSRLAGVISRREQRGQATAAGGSWDRSRHPARGTCSCGPCFAPRRVYGFSRIAGSTAYHGRMSLPAKTRLCMFASKQDPRNLVPKFVWWRWLSPTAVTSAA